MAKETVIEVRNLNKTFYLKQDAGSIIKRISSVFSTKRDKELKALSNINFSIKKGEFFGIIGHNGSGKSTLLKILMGAIKADDNSIVKTKGKMIRLALGMGFDNNLSARDNIYLNGSILGLTFREIGNCFEQIIEFSDLEEFVDVPIKFYSSGMRSRLAFAIAINANAEVFLLDELLGGVGDQNFKAKADKVFEERLLSGRTIVHVSHSLQSVKKHCDRVLVLDKGKGKLFENPLEGIRFYMELMAKKKELLSQNRVVRI